MNNNKCKKNPCETHFALVDVDLAPRPGESRKTNARKGGDAVDARAVVLARVRLAFVDVDVAILAGEPRRADALVAVDQVVAAAVVVTRMRQALVEFQIAVVPGEARPAVALVRSLSFSFKRKKQGNKETTF